jgi:hypothetical protein
MRRTLVRASMAALSQLHSAGQSPGGTAAPLPASGTLPPLALQRMHQALLDHVLKVGLHGHASSLHEACIGPLCHLSLHQNQLHYTAVLAWGLGG